VTRARQRDAEARFVVITGQSGAGKSQAIRALEDLGYFCVDNLPVQLIPMLAQLSRQAGSEIARAAVVVDVREGTFLDEFPRMYRRLRRQEGLEPLLIFLEASDDALVRRFSETRRPHPLAPGGSAIEGIRLERKRLAAIRRMADRTIDTTSLTVHELRRAFMTLSQQGAAGDALIVTIVSFGYKRGIPVDADLLFDVRFLPNPHFVASLRPKTGRDPEVVRYLKRSGVTAEFVTRTRDLLRFLIPHYVSEGKRYLTIGVGCTGGRHRSVAVAEALRRALGRLAHVRIRVQHRDVEREG
jgi:UPF0042 nucleotide-binding protein